MRAGCGASHRDRNGLAYPHLLTLPERPIWPDRYTLGARPRCAAAALESVNRLGSPIVALNDKLTIGPKPETVEQAPVGLTDVDRRRWEGWLFLPYRPFPPPAREAP